jgi:hypothetical protein
MDRMEALGNDWSRKNPGKLTLGAINPGSTQNLSAHLFKQTTDTDVVIVPHKTTPELVTSILRGDVDIGFDIYAGFQGGITDKQFRIIATSGEERNPLLNRYSNGYRKRLADLRGDQLERLGQSRRLRPHLEKAQRPYCDSPQDPVLGRRASGSGSICAAARRKKCGIAWRGHRQMAGCDRKGEHCPR